MAVGACEGLLLQTSSIIFEFVSNGYLNDDGFSVMDVLSLQNVGGMCIQMHLTRGKAKGIDWRLATLVADK